MSQPLRPGTVQTLGYLLDEVDATRGSMAPERAIRILIEDRVERYLFSRSEAEEVLHLLDAELYRRGADSLADSLTLTDSLRLQAEGYR